MCASFPYVRWWASRASQSSCHDARTTLAHVEYTSARRCRRAVCRLPFVSELPAAVPAGCLLSCLDDASPPPLDETTGDARTVTILDVVIVVSCRRRWWRLFTAAYRRAWMACRLQSVMQASRQSVLLIDWMRTTRTTACSPAYPLACLSSHSVRYARLHRKKKSALARGGVRTSMFAVTVSSRFTSFIVE